MSRQSELERHIYRRFIERRRLAVLARSAAALGIVMGCMLSACRRSEHPDSAGSASATKSTHSISTQPVGVGEYARRGDAKAASIGLTDARLRAYADVERVFEHADFYRPDESTAPAGVIQLCPLIVQEIPGDGGSERRIRIVGPVDPADADSHWSAAHPTVYFDESEIRIAGRLHRRLRYAWRTEMVLPGQARDAEAAVQSDAASWRGIEMVLGSDDFPAIYSVLPDKAEPLRCRIFYVASALEKSAIESFGRPLDGRRAAVEPDVADRPDLVVARVLDDGPIPMGPFAYASAENGAITTLLCRCMPSQVRNFSANTTYQLQHAPATIAAVWREAEADVDAEAWTYLRIPPQF